MSGLIKKIIVMSLISSMANAGLPPCDQAQVDVADPEGILTRAENTILKTIPHRVVEVIKGSNEEMGVWYEVKGTGKCIINASYEKLYPGIPMGANCMVEGAQGIGWTIAGAGKDIATGTIEAVGNVFDIDLQRLGKAGNDFADEKLQAIHQKNERSFGDLLAKGSLNFLDYIAHLFRLTSMGVGQVLKGIAVRIEALFMIPKDIVEQGIHIAEQAWIGNPEGMKLSAKKIGWRLVNSPQAVFMGCEPAIPGVRTEQ